MQARVKWVEGLTFLGESSSGHQILMDGNSGDKAPSPMEMVLMADVALLMWYQSCKRAVRMSPTAK